MCDCYIFENWACKIKKVNFYAKIEKMMLMVLKRDILLYLVWISSKTCIDDIYYNWFYDSVFLIQGKDFFTYIYVFLCVTNILTW